MTLLAPILMAGLIIAPVLLTDNDNQKRLIAVFEDNSNYSKKLEDSENIFFNLIDQSEAEKFKKDINASPFYALLEIYDSNFTIFSSQQISLNLRKSISNQLENIIEKEKLKNSGIDIKLIESAKTKVNIETKISIIKEKLFHLVLKLVWVLDLSLVY